jgi:hypothetical protein
MQISRIRLSDKTSRLHPRHVTPKGGQVAEQLTVPADDEYHLLPPVQTE